MFVPSPAQKSQTRVKTKNACRLYSFIIVGEQNQILIYQNNIRNDFARKFQSLKIDIYLGTLFPGDEEV